MKLYSFAKIIDAVYLDHFGAADDQKGKINRRQREKVRFRVGKGFLRSGLKKCQTTGNW